MDDEQEQFGKQIHRIKQAFNLSGAIFMSCIFVFCVFAFLKISKISFLGADNDWLLAPWALGVIAWFVGWHFQTKAKDVRCPKCAGLFFAKGRGSGVVFADKCCLCGWGIKLEKEN